MRVVGLGVSQVECKEKVVRDCFSRRSALRGALGGGAFALFGCSRPPADRDGEAMASAAETGAQVSQDRAMVVYRDPSCGCCEAWAAIARQAGYAVTVRDDADMPALKRRLGVPEALDSCHTTVIEDYLVEGHVPMQHVARLLRERPPGVRGIGVPGMPLGSPGMEAPDGSGEDFQVFAFDAAGKTQQFTA